MKCPRCDSSKMRVVDSREGVDGRSVRRRRECEACEFRFTTFERIEESLPMVVKKGGGRESFDRYKVLAGMKRACEKRPVSVLDLEESIKQIETQLLECGDKEVSSETIGAMVSESLKQLDQVAYVRFASVYREFSDVKEFVETLSQLGAPVELSNSDGISLSSASGEIKSRSYPRDTLPSDTLPSSILPSSILPSNVLPINSLPVNSLPVNPLPVRSQASHLDSEKSAGMHLVLNPTSKKKPADVNLTLIDK